MRHYPESEFLGFGHNSFRPLHVVLLSSKPVGGGSFRAQFIAVSGGSCAANTTHDPGRHRARIDAALSAAVDLSEMCCRPEVFHRQTRSFHSKAALVL